MNYIGKILPVEGYYVRLDGDLAVNYHLSLTHLYQPLVGMQAVMLYHTLLNDINLQREHTVQTHHTLMNYLNSPLDTIYKARLKLEGIGLLKTYVTEKNDIKTYTYALQSPFSPRNFFKDTMLYELLYHHLGELKFNTLKNYFTPTLTEESMEHEITASFTDVFETFQPTLATENVSKDDEVEISKHSTRPMKDEGIDFSWIELMLKQRMIPVHKVLTRDNKKLIADMMFLYDLPSHDIEKSILWALTDENVLDVEEFKAACHDLFKTTHNTPIRLVPAYEQSEQTQQKASKAPETMEEQLIREFETISPKQLLEDLSSGHQASERELKMIRDVMTNHGLEPAVMNVLIHYVLMQSNMKLSKPYLETIATHWSRARIKTAKEAMEFAKKEIDKARKRKEKRRSHKQAHQEVIPDWFKDREKQQKKLTKNKSSPQQTIDEEKEKEEILALLRKHSSKNNHVQG